MTSISGQPDVYMNRIALTALLCLFASLGHATFEIKDPAAEAMDDLEKADGTATINMENSACSEYASGREKSSDAYWSALKWLIEYMGAAGAGQSVDYDPDAMARWIDNYCRENPGHNLGTAAEAFVKTGL